MRYIEIDIESSLWGDDAESIVLRWAEHLWTSRLTSTTYQLLYALTRSESGPIGIYISETFSNKEIPDLINSILGLTRNNVFFLINSFQPPDERLCKIAFTKVSDVLASQELSSFERYPDFNIICTYDHPIGTDIYASTYEQRIGLPYSSGKRDGIVIENYTSRIFLPCITGNSEEVIIDDSIDQQNWFSIPRFHGEMVITRSSVKSSLPSCASVYSQTSLAPGYYCIEMMYTTDNSSSQMINLHALLEDRNFFDCQATISESVSPNFAVDQFCKLAIPSGLLILIYFRLPTLAEAFSSKLFLGPHLDECRSSHVRIRHMRLLRIQESWGN
jgi:hypothetical protein